MVWKGYEKVEITIVIGVLPVCNFLSYKGRIIILSNILSGSSYESGYTNVYESRALGIDSPKLGKTRQRGDHVILTGLEDS